MKQLAKVYIPATDKGHGGTVTIQQEKEQGHGISMKKEFFAILNEVRQIGLEMLATMERGWVVTEQNVAHALFFAQVIDVMKEQVPKAIYSAYGEFFDSFQKFCSQCGETKFLQENCHMMTSSLELFLECLNEIEVECHARGSVCPCCGETVIYAEGEESAGLCPECGSGSRERLVTAFFKKEGLQKAAEGTKVLQLAPAVPLSRWMLLNCPQIDYEITDLFMDVTTYAEDIQYVEGCRGGSYDLIILAQAGTSILEDSRAVCQLKRILKPDGKLVFLQSSEVTDRQQEGFWTHQLGTEYFGEKVDAQCGLSDSSRLYVYTKSQEVSLCFAEPIVIDEALCKEGPLVSVIMSCYNHGEFVGEAIESVLNQSYRNIEFLVADDASTDNSVEVMKRYSEHFAKAFYFAENAGGRLHMLKEQTTGKYIAIMNSDDVWEPDKIALQVKYMEEHEECGACFTWCQYVDENLTEINNPVFLQRNRSSYEWMRFFWEHGNALCNPSSLIRRELSIARPRYGSCSWQLPDFFKWVDLVQRCSVYVLPKVMIRMRRYQKRNVENVSAISEENMARHIVELGYNWLWVIRDMDAAFFKKAFGDDFVNQQASTEEEIKCEKYFLMLRHESIFIQSSALSYLVEIYNEVRECLENNYHYDVKRIKEDMLKKGFGQSVQ